MFNSVALNVVVSLVFIYLLYSLLATTINEALASIFNLRAKKLELAIQKMLDDGIMNYHNVWHMLGDFFINLAKNMKSFLQIFSFKKGNKAKSKMTLVELFYEHPGIKYLGENKISNKPAYVSANFFSNALIDILAEKSDNPTAIKQQQVLEGMNKIENCNETKALLISMFAESNNDLDKFKIYLEAWFEETMNRTSGWYKKQSQKITFVIGLVLAVSFNVDTITIVNKLSRNPESAKHLSDLATKYVETHKDSLGKLEKIEAQTAEGLFEVAKKQEMEDIQNSNTIIGLGWVIPFDTMSGNCGVGENALRSRKDDSLKCQVCLDKVKRASLFGARIHLSNAGGEISVTGKIRYVLCMAFSSGRRILGYLLTALAISFGAPFWFDLLNKIIQIRGAGTKPEVKKQNSSGS